MAWPAMTAAGLLLLGACDGGASAVPVHREGSVTPASAPTETRADGLRRADDPREAPVPQVDGKPMWSANRRYTAEQNARRQFERNGEAFGARSVKDYVAKAHAFVSDPPPGAKTLTRRSNGDLLIYDPASNVFAVATKEGAPRVMFKPDEGPAYWEDVKKQEAERASRRSRRSEGGGADSGG